MFAWVRYSAGSMPGDKAVRLDVDLSDEQGNICVEMRGFATRVLEGETRSAQAAIVDPRILHLPDPFTDTNVPFTDTNVPFDGVFYQNLIADIVNRKLSVDEAAELG